MRPRRGNRLCASSATSAAQATRSSSWTVASTASVACRDLRRSFSRMVSYGLRLIGRNKGFSGTAIVTLALAIGGNVALFAIVNALFLQPLPIPSPETLMRVYTGESRVSWLNFETSASETPSSPTSSPSGTRPCRWRESRSRSR